MHAHADVWQLQDWRFTKSLTSKVLFGFWTARVHCAWELVLEFAKFWGALSFFADSMQEMTGTFIQKPQWHLHSARTFFGVQFSYQLCPLFNRVLSLLYRSLHVWRVSWCCCKRACPIVGIDLHKIIALSKAFWKKIGFKMMVRWKRSRTPEKSLSTCQSGSHFVGALHLLICSCTVYTLYSVYKSITTAGAGVSLTTFQSLRPRVGLAPCSSSNGCPKLTKLPTVLSPKAQQSQNENSLLMLCFMQIDKVVSGCFWKLPENDCLTIFELMSGGNGAANWTEHQEGFHSRCAKIAGKTQFGRSGAAIPMVRQVQRERPGICQSCKDKPRSRPSWFGNVVASAGKGHSDW